MTHESKKRIRIKKPGPLAGIISEWIRQNGSTYRGLADRTKDLAQALDPNDEGVSWSVVGSIMRGETQEPSPRNLWLLSQAMGMPLGDLLQAIGYDPYDLQTTPADAERQRTLAMVRGAPDDDVRRAARILQLDQSGKDAVDALLAAVEKRLQNG